MTGVTPHPANPPPVRPDRDGPTLALLTLTWAVTTAVVGAVTYYALRVGFFLLLIHANTTIELWWAMLGLWVVLLLVNLTHLVAVFLKRRAALCRVLAVTQWVILVALLVSVGGLVGLLGPE